MKYLGRAQEDGGDEGASRKPYEKSPSLWKDADPSLRIFRRAKAQYASCSERCGARLYCFTGRLAGEPEVSVTDGSANLDDFEFADYPGGI